MRPEEERVLLGHIPTITGGEMLGADIAQVRDAVHVAVLRAKVGDEQLQPGQRVVLKDGRAVPAGDAAPLGIVDPFLPWPVTCNSLFWLLIWPQTITSLRHQWSHPALDASREPSESERWIRAFAERLDQSYGALMAAAETFAQDSAYARQRAQEDEEKGIRRNPWEYETPRMVLDNRERYKDVDATEWPLFWHHYEVVTGEKVPEEFRECFFYCSC